MAKKDAMTENTEAVLDQVNATVSEQVQLLSKCFELYQAQMQKAGKLWVDGATSAMQEGQKAAKEWMDLGNQMAADVRKTFETSAREMAGFCKPAA